MLPDLQGKSSDDIQHYHKAMGVYLEVAQYPILGRCIRERMRHELFSKGIISLEDFESEVRNKAILSQKREGLTEPYVEEPVHEWNERVSFVRDQLTDFYFAYNLPHERLREIIQSVLSSRTAEPYGGELALNFNPELAPWALLFAKGEEFERLPPDKRALVRHHLEEIIVVLIKGMISDRLEFIGVAKELFTIQDLKDIWRRRIGRGKIGGKAAGMLLAWKILQKFAPAIAERTTIPNSYFIASDVFYDFLSINGLALINQKYKSRDQIEAEYPDIRAAYEQGRFPEDIAEQLRDILRQVGNTPLIVRSSSLLEDSQGTSFAGKYESYFCPNQGTPKDNLRELTLAIRRIYASVYNPDALFYRRHMGLIDYDERMAILLQQVQGQPYGRYFFPALAGVAFSYSPIVWSPVLRREEGFVRLVLGLGTRAVERVGEDYPRLVVLSHPTLRPDVSPEAIRRHSQRMVDLINLEDNTFDSLPASQVLDRDYPALKWVASTYQEGTLLPLLFIGPRLSPDQLVLTFDNLLRDGEFAQMMRGMLSTLEQHYRSPVDVEFAMTLDPSADRPRPTLHLLQCRPQSSMRAEAARPIPASLPEADKLFLSTHMVPQGYVARIEYIVYVDPAAYSQIADPLHRKDVARVVGKLNNALEKHNFILMGPGRWGSSNINLGVPVTYADIYNARALVEIAAAHHGVTPEPSYGTHFFQDLVEAHIYPLAIYPQAPGDFLNQAFINQAQNGLEALLAGAAGDGASYVKVIHVPAERDGQCLDIAMDGKQALAYFTA